MTASEYDAELVSAGAEFTDPPSLVLVGPHQSRVTSGALRLKRGLDVVVSCVSIVLALPFALAIAVAIKVSSRGPVLYKQERVGRDGELFVMLKFRTMRVGTHGEILRDPDAAERYAANDFKLPPDDPRITPLGRILRKSSVDELPQLLNVLFGKMSLVGIRPIEAAQLALRRPADRQIYMMLRPGLTGLWQINGRSKMDPADRITLDSRYVAHWSIWGDLAILLRTPLAVLNLRHTN